MSIDLTGADEQEWLEGNEALPVRYSELTTDEERSAAAENQLVKPMAEVLSDRLPQMGYEGTGLTPKRLGIIAKLALGYLNESDDVPSVASLLETTDSTDEEGNVEMDLYLRRVASTAVTKLPKTHLRRIAVRARDIDTEQTTDSPPPARDLTDSSNVKI